MPPAPGAFKCFPDRYDIESLTVRRGNLSPAQETVYRALSELQDRFTLAGRDEESRAMQSVLEDFCGRWGGMYGEG